jgi:hypothetical protein
VNLANLRPPKDSTEVQIRAEIKVKSTFCFNFLNHKACQRQL